MDLLEINSMILALECRALKVEEAINWADKLILESNEPDLRLFDVSTSKNSYEVISHLKAFGKHDRPDEVAKRAFSLFAKGLLEHKTTYDLVTRKLYDMAFSGFIPAKESEGLMMCFWDELGDAKLGVYGDADTLQKECLDFLYQYGN